MTEQEFLSTAQWKRKRAAILKRDKYQCRHCRRFGRLTEAVVVHHIQHYDEHPELALVDSNLVSLCIPCHNKQHPERAKNLHRMYG